VFTCLTISISYKINGIYDSNYISRKLIGCLILANSIILAIASIHMEGDLIGIPMAYLMFVIGAVIYFIALGGIIAGYELIILFIMPGVFLDVIKGTEIYMPITTLLGAVIRTLIVLAIVYIAEKKYRKAFSYMKGFEFDEAIYHLNQAKNLLKNYSHPNYSHSENKLSINLIFPSNTSDKDEEFKDMFLPYFNRELGIKLEMMEDAIFEIMDAENDFKNGRWRSATSKYYRIIRKYPNLRNMLSKRLDIAKSKCDAN
jgi:hypothetical protein